MRPKMWAWSLGVPIVLFTLLLVSPLAAASGGPILDYLQDVIKPELDLIQRAVAAIDAGVGAVRSTVNSIQTTVNATQGTVNATQSTVNQIFSKVNEAPHISVVRTKFTTTENSSTSFNLDSNAIPLPPPSFPSKVMRYTISLVIISPSGVWVPGVDSFRLVDGVYDGISTTADVNVAAFDPAIQRSLLAGPYTGLHSFVHFQRGADGAGNVEVWVNAFIESEP